MLARRQRRQDTDTLIWEYLDGEISPTRARTLSGLLQRRAAARERLVESAMLHSMLFAHFCRQGDQGDAVDAVDAGDKVALPPLHHGRRRRGKHSAA